MTYYFELERERLGGPIGGGGEVYVGACGDPSKVRLECIARSLAQDSRRYFGCPQNNRQQFEVCFHRFQGFGWPTCPLLVQRRPLLL